MQCCQVNFLVDGRTLPEETIDVSISAINLDLALKILEFWNCLGENEVNNNSVINTIIHMDQFSTLNSLEKVILVVVLLFLCGIQSLL